MDLGSAALLIEHPGRESVKRLTGFLERRAARVHSGQFFDEADIAVIRLQLDRGKREPCLFHSCLLLVIDNEERPSTHPLTLERLVRPSMRMLNNSEGVRIMGAGRLLERLARRGTWPAVSEIHPAAIAPGRESKGESADTAGASVPLAQTALPVDVECVRHLPHGLEPDALPALGTA